MIQINQVYYHYLYMDLLQLMIQFIKKQEKKYLVYKIHIILLEVQQKVLEVHILDKIIYGLWLLYHKL